MERTQIDKILEIGISLAAEHNYDELLAKIVDCAMDLTGSDGGTLYLYEDDRLHFCITKNSTLGVNRRGNDREQYPPVPLTEENVCAYSALHRKLLNIEDAYGCEEFDFSGPREYDRLTGYRTKSVLVFPLVNHEDKLVGVVQLINALDERGNVIPYDRKYEKIVKSLGSQAAVAVSNMRFVKEIKNLMVSITQVFTDAIDTRIPYNYYHSRNVYLYVQMLVDYINRRYEEGKSGHHFSVADRDEILMAALLHDIGKLVIPNEIIDKTTRLGDKLPLVLEHIQHLTALLHVDYLERRLEKSRWIQAKNYLLEASQRVEELNRKPTLTDEDVEYVRELASKKYTGAGGGQIPYLSLQAAECLSVRRGNLTAQERDIIRSHVEYTEKYLRKMNFGERYPHIIEWAGAHHEMLDGSGYPRGIKGEEIPFEARILAIVDVFEALTSSDRPYKKSMEEGKALSVLDDMAREGKVDKDVLQLFKEALSEMGDDVHLLMSANGQKDE